MGSCCPGVHIKNQEIIILITNEKQNENESPQINTDENSKRSQQEEQINVYNKSGNFNGIKQAQSEYIGGNEVEVIILNEKSPENSQQSLDNKQRKQINESCIESTTQLLVKPNQQAISLEQQKNCNQQSLIQHTFLQSNVRQQVQQYNQSQH